MRDDAVKGGAQMRTLRNLSKKFGGRAEPGEASACVFSNRFKKKLDVPRQRIANTAHSVTFARWNASGRAEAMTPTRVQRYTIYDEIDSGGMATVHLARLNGPLGFSRVVAVKRLHPHLVRDQEFKAMFVNEARLAARVHHPNVVPIVDVLVNDGEVLIVMEYVHGVTLSVLNRAAYAEGGRLPLSLSAAMIVNVLHGLHAAHDARNADGDLLGLVHRDVSPQNIIVGEDGLARLLDFGVAKAAQLQPENSHPGVVKGKHSYFSPEALRSEPVTGQADVFSIAAVLWELITGTKLFDGQTPEARVLKIIGGDYPCPSALAPDTPPEIDRIVMKGLDPDVRRRYQTALEMADDLEKSVALASQRVIGDAVSRLAAKDLEDRAALVHRIERSPSIPPPLPVSSTPATAAALDVTLRERKPVRKGRARSVAGPLLLAIAVLGATFGLRYRSHVPVASAAEQSNVAATTAARTFEQVPHMNAAGGKAESSGTAAAEASTSRASQPAPGPSPRAHGHGNGKFLPTEL
jgi:serine/threonine protein kinase